MQVLRGILLAIVFIASVSISASSWANCYQHAQMAYPCPQMQAPIYGQQMAYPAPYQYSPYDHRQARREQRAQEREMRRQQREYEREMRREQRERERQAQYDYDDSPYDDECESGRCDDINRGPDKTVKGIGLGAIVGAILGGVIGGNGQSAAIGAGAGALFGGAVGSGMDRNEELECQQRFLSDEYRYGYRYNVHNSSNYYIAANVGYYHGYPQSHCRQYQYVQFVQGPYGAAQQTTLVHYCYFQQGWQAVQPQYFVLH